MKYKVLEDFETYEEVEQDVIRLYKSKIPEKLLDTWKEYGFGSFMDNYIKIINPKEYKEAVIENGKLNFDECFGYVPLLRLGGSEKVENLKKVKIKEHIELIMQMVGKIEQKNISKWDGKKGHWGNGYGNHYSYTNNIVSSCNILYY